MADFQLKQDWKEKFITDVEVVPSSERCKDGYRELFRYSWRGLKAIYKSPNKQTGGVTFESVYKSGRSSSALELIKGGFPLIKAGVFKGKRICGMESKYSYADIVQPNRDGCPRSTVLCPGTTGSKRICLPKSEFEAANDKFQKEHCPLTSISFSSQEISESD